ncbi:U2 small nuclear ribonucleoprotein A', partial [Coelomomyces lativittatus]
MVNLSADFFSKVETFLNPLNDRELNLRGYKIPMLEHLGACCRQMDTLNLMDNELKVLAGPFPSLPRLRHVYLTNNRLHSLEPGLERYFPFLETLLFTNNAFTELKYVRYLHGLKHLTHVSFLGNPITKHKWYRSYVIYHVPQIRVLDYQRVKER